MLNQILLEPPSTDPNVATASAPCLTVVPKAELVTPDPVYSPIPELARVNVHGYEVIRSKGKAYVVIPEGGDSIAPTASANEMCCDQIANESVRGLVASVPSAAPEVRDFIQNVEGKCKQFATYREAALHWFERGFCVIPIRPTEKRPAVLWDPWIEDLSSEKISKYWVHNPSHELGFITGDEILVLDADSEESMDALATLEQRFHLKPNLVVRTTKGVHHYFRRAVGVHAKSDAHSTEEHPERLDVKTGRAVIIMPPSTGKSVTVCEIESTNDLVCATQEFIDAIFKHNGRESVRPVAASSASDVEPDAAVDGQDVVLRRLNALTKHISPDLGRDDWVHVLMAIFHETHGSEDGFLLADSWSAQGEKYKGTQAVRGQWASFRRDVERPFTIGLLIRLARAAGADTNAIIRDDGDRFESCATETITSVNRVLPEAISAINVARAIPLGDVSAQKQMRNLQPKAGGAGKTYALDTVGLLDPDAFPDKAFQGKLPCTIANLNFLMESHGISVRYNEIRKKLQFILPGHVGTFENADQTAHTQILNLAMRHNMLTTHIGTMLEAIGDRHVYNAMADWINSKPWDRVDRMPLIYQTLTVRDGYPNSLKDVLLKRWLLSIVAATFKRSDFRSRGVLTLQGPQAIGKTTWIKSLISDESLQGELIKLGHHLDAGNKDSILTAVSHLIVEIGELDSSFRKDVARLKGFLTDTHDKIRRPYARGDSEYPRRTIFCASVNDSSFLVDHTGNSRWWTISVEHIDFNHGIDMQQVFAQLAIDFVNDEKWWLTSEEEAALELLNSEHRVVSAIYERLLTAINLDCSDTEGVMALTASGVLAKLDIEHPTNAQAKECGAFLREYFGQPKKINGSMKWRVPFRDNSAALICSLAGRPLGRASTVKGHPIIGGVDEPRYQQGVAADSMHRPLSAIDAVQLYALEDAF